MTKKKRKPDTTSPSRIHGTLQYFCASIWGGLNQRTVNGSHPNWNHPELIRYLEKGIELHITHEEWKLYCAKYGWLIEVIYKAGEKPSIDRIDPNGHYSLDNIEIVTLGENIRRSHNPEINKYEQMLLPKKQKVIDFVTKEIFESSVACAKAYGLVVSEVSRICLLYRSGVKRPSRMKYTLKYLEDYLRE